MSSDAEDLYTDAPLDGNSTYRAVGDFISVTNGIDDLDVVRICTRPYFTSFVQTF